MFSSLSSLVLVVRVLRCEMGMPHTENSHDLKWPLLDETQASLRSDSVPELGLPTEADCGKSGNLHVPRAQTSKALLSSSQE